MAAQKINSKIVDANLFFQEAQVDALHEKFYGHEVHPSDELSQTIDTVNSINTKTLSPAARKKFQSLCGRLDKINTNMMIDAIVDEAQMLKQSDARHPKDIEALRQSILEIWQNNSNLSDVNSYLLRFALIMLAELSSEKPSDEAYLPLPPHQGPEALPESTISETKVETNWEEAEIAFALLSISEHFYQGKVQEGLAMVKTLPHEIKLSPISEMSSPAEIVSFIQEATIKSFEIARKDGYVPSFQEVLDLLEEASSLS